MSKKQLKLLENGLCFIIQSIKNFKQSEKDIRNSEKELKYSCICLFSGIFLILKEKLSQEHWSLLFSDVNKANKKDLKTGNFHSVNFSDCRKRLSEIVSIEFTEKESKMLDSLREKRIICNNVDIVEFIMKIKMRTASPPLVLLVKEIFFPDLID